MITFSWLKRRADIVDIPLKSSDGDHFIQAESTLHAPPFSANRPQIFLFNTMTSTLHTPPAVFVTNWFDLFVWAINPSYYLSFDVYRPSKKTQSRGENAGDYEY